MLDDVLELHGTIVPMPPIAIDQAIQVAVKHHQAGRLAEAERIYRQILAQQENQVDTLHLLGVVALQTGRSDLAIELIGRAIAANPNAADYHMNFGVALRQKWRLEDAVLAYREAIRLKFDYPEAHSNLGNALTCLGRIDEAIPAYSSAIQLRPAYGDAWANLANALKDQGKLDEAAGACEKAIELNPASGPVHNNLANILKEKGLIAEALASYDRAIALNPSDPGFQSNRLYLLHFHPDYDAVSICAEHRKWNQRHAEPLAKLIQPHAAPVPSRALTSAGERRLKIGYVSPDLSTHPVGRFLLPLLEQHDRGRFEVFCYSDVRVPDAMTGRIRAAADTWRSIVGAGDDSVAQLVRRDGIDILVDLTMHSANGRLLVFARKPAPVLVSYLAYCSTTGLTTMDYRFTDAHLDPPAAGDENYSEKSIRLQTYWCYEPTIAPSTPSPALTSSGQPSSKQAVPAVEPPPALVTGHVTFGCLNSFAKVSPAALTAWSRLLGKVPGSRLLLHARQGSHRQRVMDLFAREGVDPARVAFVGPVPIAEYFALYNRIDICLDPFPYAGGTTTCDALWMGVPVVTLSGNTAVARAGVSILSSAGFAEWVAHSPDQYVQLAAELACDLPRLAQLRAALRERLRGSLLMDAQRFAADVEAAYREMWRVWSGECQ